MSNVVKSRAATHWPDCWRVHGGACAERRIAELIQRNHELEAKICYVTSALDEMLDHLSKVLGKTHPHSNL